MSPSDSGANELNPIELVADGLLTVQECAQFLHLSRSKVYEMMDAGDLCHAKLGRSRRIPRRAAAEQPVERVDATLRESWLRTGAIETFRGGHGAKMIRRPRVETTGENSAEVPF